MLNPQGEYLADFGGFKVLNFNIFWVFLENMTIFFFLGGGVEMFVDIN